MAKAKKLPSGSWRVQLFVGRDSAGKPKYKSFTAPAKKEAEYLAANYALTLSEEKKAEAPTRITFNDAMTKWIDNRRNVLSPATTRVYDSMQKNAYTALLNKPITSITVADVQSAINVYAATHSPKSVRNAYGLLRSVIAQHNPRLLGKFDQLNLPSLEDHDIVIPEDDSITPMILYLRSLKEKDDMLIVVLLAATLGLRRSEICALTQDDFFDGKVRIDKALVLSYDNKTYVVKGTKSKAGRRILSVEPSVYATIKAYGCNPRTGRIISTTPARVSCRYTTLAKRFGVPGSLHDLRHYYASILAALNVPVKYAMQRLGHSTPQVTEKVYQHALSAYDQKFNDVVNEHTAHLVGGPTV